MMNSVSNRVRHTINKLDKTTRLVDIGLIYTLSDITIELFKAAVVTL